MPYTDEELAVVCPKCHAGRGGKCLERNSGGYGGMHYIEEPHPWRVEYAKKGIDFMETPNG